jgi:hypothetical protein
MVDGQKDNDEGYGDQLHIGSEVSILIEVRQSRESLSGLRKSARQSYFVGPTTGVATDPSARKEDLERTRGLRAHGPQLSGLRTVPSDGYSRTIDE